MGREKNGSNGLGITDFSYTRTRKLAWMLLGQMQYQEAVEMFLQMTELNSWSHMMYYFLTAGSSFTLFQKYNQVMDRMLHLFGKPDEGTGAVGHDI